MNTIKELRQALAEEATRLQPARGLEQRVLRHTLNAVPGIERPRGRFRTASFEWTLGAVAVLLAVAVVAGLLHAGTPRTWIPGGSTGHAISRAGSGMVTSTVGWVVGAGRGVLRTNDGGFHWTDVTPAGYTSNFIDTYFLDANHAWLTEYERSSSSTIVFRTSDGGASWQRSQPIGLPGMYRTGPASLFFIDPAHGWLLLTGLAANESQGPRSEFLEGTTDGGADWQRLSDSHSQPSACPWSTVVFSGLTTGWITTSCPSGGGLALLVSQDGGATWSLQSLPAALSGSYPGPTSPIFFDSSDGIFLAGGAGLSLTLFVTSNGGQTWSTRPLPGQIQGAGAVSFVDPSHGWAVGGTGDMVGDGSSVTGAKLPLYHTDDGGTTWTPVLTNLLLDSPMGRVRDVNFVDQLNGFAMVFNGTAGTPITLFKTADGGANWTVVGQFPFGS